MADRYVPIPQNEQGRYVQITPQLAAQIQSRGQQQSPIGPTQPQPSSLNTAFRGLGQTAGLVQPFLAAAGYPALTGGAGALGGAAQIGAALTNPYANTAQKIVGATGGAVQGGSSLGQAAGLIGPTLGRYVPYLGTALALGSIFAGNAPDNVKYGQATNAVGSLAATKLGAATAAPAVSAAGGAGALGAGSTMATAAFAAMPYAVMAAIIAKAVENETKSDYAPKRRRESLAFNQFITPFTEHVMGAQNEAELRDVMERSQRGEFGASKFGWQDIPGREALTGAKYLGSQQGFNADEIVRNVKNLVDRQRNLFRAAGSGDPEALNVLQSARKRFTEYKDVSELFGPQLGAGKPIGDYNPETGFSGIRSLNADVGTRQSVYERVFRPNTSPTLIDTAVKYGFDFWNEPVPSYVSDPLHMASASA